MRMRLEELKLKIDNHYDSISAEELFRKMTEEYGMLGYSLEDKNSEQLAHAELSAEIA